MKEIKRLYQQTALNQLLVGLLIFMIIGINYELIMGLLPTDYKDSFGIFFLLGLAKLIDMGLGMNGVIIINSKYYKWDTYFSLVLLIVSFVGNVYLIPQYGLYGAALATCIAIIVFNLIKYVFVLLKLRMSPFSSGYFKLVACGVLCYSTNYIIPDLGLEVFDPIIKTILVTLLFCSTLFFLKVSPYFNKVVNRIMSFILTQRVS